MLQNDCSILFADLLLYAVLIVPAKRQRQPGREHGLFGEDRGLQGSEEHLRGGAVIQHKVRILIHTHNGGLHTDGTFAAVENAFDTAV